MLPRSRLARRLEGALDALDELSATNGSIGKWDLIHPARMRRSLIRHPWAYRTKAFLAAVVKFGALTEGAAVVLFPIFMIMWMMAQRPQREQALAPYRLNLVRCEIEDLQDEIERRLARRKPSP